MDTVISNKTELLEFIAQHNKIQSDCDHAKYLSWENKDPEQTDYFYKVAKIQNPVDWSSQTNYWGNNAPIELNKYPYWMCEIQKCKKCGKLFFHYHEDSGHSQQLRYRLIRPELLIDTTEIKYMNLAIPYSLDDFFKSINSELDPTNDYDKSWDGLWETLNISQSLPKEFVLYNYNVFETNYKEKAKKLIDIAERFNENDRKEKLIIKAGNIG